jgi:hypothetical protein
MVESGTSIGRVARESPQIVEERRTSRPPRAWRTTQRFPRHKLNYQQPASAKTVTGGQDDQIIIKSENLERSLNALRKLCGQAQGAAQEKRQN